MDNRYNHKNRRKYSLKAHIVLVTKYRKNLLINNIADDVKQKITAIANRNGLDIVAMETDNDHIHFLIGCDATSRLCDNYQNYKTGNHILSLATVFTVSIQTLLEEESILV